MIGKNIKRMRERRGLTQEQLAEKLNVSNKTVSSWEVDRTEPKMDMVDRITMVLKCQRADITGEPIVLTTEEYNVIKAYRESKDIIKQAICDMLHVEREILPEASGEWGNAKMA